jgi:hypothetical protein
MVRLMRAVPELVTLIKGMAAAARSVSSTLLLLTIVLYVFGIIFTAQLGKGKLPECADEELAILNCREEWSSIPKSMYSLIMAGTFLDNIADVLVDLRDTNWQMLLLFLVYVLLSCLTILNMLIGVLCEVVSAVSASESETTLIMDTQRELGNVYHQLMDTRGRGGSKNITHADFESMHNDITVQRAMKQIGVEPKHMNALATVLFQDEAKPGELRELDFEDFVSRVVRLRPEKPCSVMDVADLRFCLRSDVVHTRDSHEQKLGELLEQQKRFEELTAKVVGKLKSLDERVEAAEAKKGKK